MASKDTINEVRSSIFFKIINLFRSWYVTDYTYCLVSLDYKDISLISTFDLNHIHKSKLQLETENCFEYERNNVDCKLVIPWFL